MLLFSADGYELLRMRLYEIAGDEQELLRDEHGSDGDGEPEESGELRERKRRLLKDIIDSFTDFDELDPKLRVIAVRLVREYDAGYYDSALSYAFEFLPLAEEYVSKSKLHEVLDNLPAEVDVAIEDISFRWKAWELDAGNELPPIEITDNGVLYWKKDRFTDKKLGTDFPDWVYEIRDALLEDRNHSPLFNLYEEMHKEPAPAEIYEKIHSATQSNQRLAESALIHEFGIGWSDYKLSLVKTSDVYVLEKYFEYDNWSINNGIVYEGLVFVNQINGGDEWLTLKQDDNGDYFPFESVTFEGIIERGEFEDYIADLVASTPDEAVHLNYGGAAQRAEGKGVSLANKAAEATKAAAQREGKGQGKPNEREER